MSTIQYALIRTHHFTVEHLALVLAAKFSFVIFDVQPDDAVVLTLKQNRIPALIGFSHRHNVVMATAIAQNNLTPFANFQYEDCMGRSYIELVNWHNFSTRVDLSDEIADLLMFAGHMTNKIRRVHAKDDVEDLAHPVHLFVDLGHVFKSGSPADIFNRANDFLCFVNTDSNRQTFARLGQIDELERAIAAMLSIVDKTLPYSGQTEAWWCKP